MDRDPTLLDRDPERRGKNVATYKIELPEVKTKVRTVKNVVLIDGKPETVFTATSSDGVTSATSDEANAVDNLVKYLRDKAKKEKEDNTKL